jgi:hypothetical protein
MSALIEIHGEPGSLCPLQSKSKANPVRFGLAHTQKHVQELYFPGDDQRWILKKRGCWRQ